MRAPISELQVVVRIDNWDDLLAAYGIWVGEHVRAVVLRNFAVPGLRCQMAPGGAPYLYIDVNNANALCPDPDGPVSLEALNEQLLTRIPSTRSSGQRGGQAAT